MQSNQPANTAAYIVSVKWLRAYHNFLLFDQFDRGVPMDKLTYQDDHFKSAHPGPIKSMEDLCEADERHENLLVCLGY